MYKTFIRQIAGLLVITGFIIMVPAVVALIYEEWYSLAGFLIAGFLVAGAGYAAQLLSKNAKEPSHKHSLAIAAFGWLAIIIGGAVPYTLIAFITPEDVMNSFVPEGMEYESSLHYFKNFLHAVFESTSAFTTTGLTMAYHEPSVGKAVLFYRHLSQFAGGAGFIVMSLAVLKHFPGQGSVFLYNSETSGTKLRANVIHTARAIWKVYILVTCILFIYLFAGTLFILPDYPVTENLFDAVNHAMAGMSTGGFSTLDDSIAGYHSVQMEVLHILPMMLGAFSLPFYYRVIIMKKTGELWSDIQTRSLIIACIAGGIILSLLLMHSSVVDDPFRTGVFQFVSAISTTGWQTSDIGAWDDLSVLFIVIFAMIVGGSSGATVGGIKVIRALLLQKGLQWHIARIFWPSHAIRTVKFNHKTLLPAEMNAELANAAVFTLIYIIFVLISTMFTLFFMPEGYTLSDALFESASAQGTVGLSSGITVPSMAPVLEVVYIIQMWTGRLEIIPALVLLRVVLYGTKARMN